MNASTARELRLLREIAHYFLSGANCYFCGQPLIAELDKRFGDKRNRPVKAQLTIHHRDENHENHARENTVWTHSGCHDRALPNCRPVKRQRRC
jgi:hypothetical protein